MKYIYLTFILLASSTYRCADDVVDCYEASKNMIGDGNKEITNQLKKMGTFKFVRLRKGVIYFCEYKKIIKNLKIIFRKNPRIWLKNKNQKQQTYYKD